MYRPRLRRLLPIVAGVAVATLGLAACGQDATAGGGGSPTATGSSEAPGSGESSSPEATEVPVDSTPLVIWAVQSGNSDSYTAGAERWNAEHPDRPIQVELMPDSGYKDKIRVALGAGQGPDLFYTWGGGGLKSYIDAGTVEPLDQFAEQYPDLVSKYVPATLGPVTFDGQVYALPIANMQPVVTFYNTKVFTENGLSTPSTYNELTALDSALSGKGITPLTLAGQSKWTYLPYIEYLVDRIGGPEVFDAIAANEPDSWSDPAVIDALTKIQDLVKAKAITPDFASLAYETGAADALLYTDKAGMLLMLASAYQNIGKAAPDFVAAGGLDAFPFPTIDGGKGDASNVVGNPSVYWALNSKSTPGHKATAAQFFAEQVEGDAWVDEILGRGGIAPVTSVGDKLTDDQKFQKFIYDLAMNADHFQMSWDQALSPEQATALLTELDKVFLLQSTPQQFADAMNATIS